MVEKVQVPQRHKAVVHLQQGSTGRLAAALKRQVLHTPVAHIGCARPTRINRQQRRCRICLLQHRPRLSIPCQQQLRRYPQRPVHLVMSRRKIHRRIQPLIPRPVRQCERNSRLNCRRRVPHPRRVRPTCKIRIPHIDPWQLGRHIRQGNFSCHSSARQWQRPRYCRVHIVLRRCLPHRLRIPAKHQRSRQ